MPQLEVTVKRLNKRKVIPTRLPDPSNIAGEVFLNDHFEGEEVVAVPNPSLGKWFVDRHGYYYWGGGVKEAQGSTITENKLRPNSYFQQLSQLTNWNESVPQIPDVWKKTKGRGVKIAVLDTGIFETHEDIEKTIIHYQDFTAEKDKVDYDGHGTHVSGIVAARSSTVNGIIGVAPESELIVLKVLSDEKDGNDPGNYDNIIQALDTAVEKGADIINMSFSLNSNIEGPSTERGRSLANLKRKLNEIANNKIIMVAAGGDKADIKNSNLFFPAVENGVISVAAITEGHFERNPSVNPNLNIVAPFINYLSTYRKPVYYERLFGCSMSCAFMTGIISLAISSNRNSASQRFSKVEILGMLNKSNMELNQMNYNDPNSFYYHILNFQA